MMPKPVPLDDEEVLNSLRVVVSRAFEKAMEMRDIPLMDDCTKLLAAIERRIELARSSSVMRLAGKLPM